MVTRVMGKYAKYGQLIENYGKHSRLVTRTEFDEKRFQTAARTYRLLYRPFLPVSKQARIVDLGCGHGEFLYFLKHEGYTSVLGVDLAADRVEFCRKYITDQVEQKDIGEFVSSLAAEAVDIFVMQDVLETIPKAEMIPLLSRIREALSRGGTLLLKVVNMDNPFNLWARYTDFLYEYAFTANSLCQVLSASGFDEITILPARHGLVPVKRSLSWRILDAMRRFLRGVFLWFLHKSFDVPVTMYGTGQRRYSYDSRLLAVARKDRMHVKDESCCLLSPGFAD
jgi:SAM-dependent methyltransferase